MTTERLLEYQRESERRQLEWQNGYEQRRLADYKEITALIGRGR